MGAGLELFARHKDGHEFQVEIRLAPFQSADGPLVVSTIREVTVRQRGRPEPGGDSPSAPGGTAPPHTTPRSPA